MFGYNNAGHRALKDDVRQAYIKQSEATVAGGKIPRPELPPMPRPTIPRWRQLVPLKS